MADPLATVTPGQPLRPTAAAWNEFVRAAKKVRELERDESRTGRTYGVWVWAKNDTGAALAAFSPVGVDGVGVFDLSGQGATDWTDDPTFTAVEPAGEDAWVGVTREPIPDGRIGRVAVGGVCVANVEVTNTEHRYAKPAAGDTTRLHSAAGGPIRLLWIASGVGSTRRCVVTVGDQVGEGGDGTAAGIVLGNVPDVGDDPDWYGTATDRIAVWNHTGIYAPGNAVLRLLEADEEQMGAVGVAESEDEAPQDLGWGHKRISGHLHLRGIGTTRLEGLWYEGGPDGYVDLWAAPLDPADPAAGYLTRAWVDDGRFDPPGFQRGRRLAVAGGSNSVQLVWTAGGLGPSYGGGGVQPSLPACVYSTAGFAADAVTDVFAGVHVGGTGISGGQRYVGGLWINATTTASPPPPPPPPPPRPEPPAIPPPPPVAPEKGSGIGGAIANARSRIDLADAIGRPLVRGDDGLLYEKRISGGVETISLYTP